MNIKINGLFDDQKGIVRRGKITGYNDRGEPCRRYTYVKPLDPVLKGKHFEAFDSQIEHSRVN